MMRPKAKLYELLHPNRREFIAGGAAIGLSGLADIAAAQPSAADRIRGSLTRADIGFVNGRWKFEAIQGVLDLSPDDIDRATLIEEISAL
jgi:hypothetical protein